MPIVNQPTKTQICASWLVPPGRIGVVRGFRYTLSPLVPDKLLTTVQSFTPFPGGNYTATLYRNNQPVNGFTNLYLGQRQQQDLETFLLARPGDEIKLCVTYAGELLHPVYAAGTNWRLYTRFAAEMLQDDGRLLNEYVGLDSNAVRLPVRVSDGRSSPAATHGTVHDLPHLLWGADPYAPFEGLSAPARAAPSGLPAGYQQLRFVTPQEAMGLAQAGWVSVRAVPPHADVVANRVIAMGLKA